jgi:hypothetical protein
MDSDGPLFGIFSQSFIFSHIQKDGELIVIKDTLISDFKDHLEFEATMNQKPLNIQEI